MSFRLQNQQASKSAVVRPWILGFLVAVIGGWFWLQRPDPVIAEAHASTIPALPSAPVVNAEKAPLIVAVGFQEHAAEPDFAPVKKRHGRHKPAGLNNKGQFISYAFHFEGVALVGDAPCAGTHLRIQLADGSHRRVIDTTTDEHGAYHATLLLETIANRSVDWSLQSMEDKFQPLELAGRHIVIPDETSITVEQSLHFVGA